jgi:hypothetical protein
MDLVHNDIKKMALLPPHCPMTPASYTTFFNDRNKLANVVPYKIITEKHKRDGHLVQRLEYNNFYTNWKQDSLKWTSRMEQPLDAVENINTLQINSDTNLELYKQTKRKEQFAVPLPTNGTNQVRILFNDKCNVPTFKYKRYATESVASSSRYNNPLYLEDVSYTTQELKGSWMNSIVQNGMDLYSSVFEDMYILTNNTRNTIENYNENDSENDNLEKIKKTY